jgi:hypothetical protein
VPGEDKSEEIVDGLIRSCFGQSMFLIGTLTVLAGGAVALFVLALQP